MVARLIFCWLGEVAGAPEVPACDGRPGLPAGGSFAHDVGLGEVGGGDFVGGLEAEEGEGEAFADAVVVYREDVGAAEAEDEEHLYGPLSNAPYLRKLRDDGFVGHAANAGEGGDGAVEGFGGEVAEGEGLVVREAGGAELLVGAVEEVLCGEVLCGAGGCSDGIEAFEQASVDGGCGFAVELLIDDALYECFEGGLGAGEPEGEGACTLDEAREFGIGGGEFAEGERGVVAWRAWAGEWARHGVNAITLRAVKENCEE